MLRIDNNLLQEVGLSGLPDSDKNSLLRHIYETLEMRVGIRLADQMSNEQLDEFERYFEAKDDAGAFKWLETNFPNYKEIVQQEFEKLKAEVAQSAPQILSSSGTGMQQQQVQPMSPQQPIQPQVDQPPAQQYAPPAPAQPIPPPPSLPGDINMPTQPGQFNPYPGSNPASVPPPMQPPVDLYATQQYSEPSPVPPMPPQPDQQPPAGPGNPGGQF